MKGQTKSGMEKLRHFVQESCKGTVNSDIGVVLPNSSAVFQTVYLDKKQRELHESRQQTFSLKDIILSQKKHGNNKNFFVHDSSFTDEKD